MSPLRFPSSRILSGVAAAFAVGGLSLGHAAVGQDLPLSAEYDGIAEDEFPLLLGNVAGDRATVQVIRDGRVVASGTLDENGGLESGALPAGVYSVFGRVGGGVALFAYKITEGAVTADDAAPLRLVAPASDWPLVRSILTRRFSTFLPARTATPGRVQPGVVQPGVAAPAPQAVVEPIASTNATAARRVEAVAAGATGLVTRFDAAGRAVPVPLADVYLLRSGALLTTLKADENGLFKLPATLGTGIHTLLTIHEGGTLADSGVSVTGLSVTGAAMDDRSVSNPVEVPSSAVVRPAALTKVIKQGADFSVAQGPASDFGPALGVSGEDQPLGPPVAPTAGFGSGAGGLGGGAAGGGGGLGGGGLISALVGAGIGAGIASAIDDDDDDVLDDDDSSSPTSP